MTFAVIRIPGFALQAVLRLEPGLSRRAVVLLGDGRRGGVWQMSTPAVRDGVERGMTAAQVLARCPGAIIRARSFSAEESVSRILISCSRSFAPRVEATEPGLCTVDLRGVLPRHRAEHPRRILRQLAQFGLKGRVGLARTPALARFVSLRADPVLEVDGEEEEVFLRTFPLALAELSPSLEARLTEWGITSLGAFRCLSRQSVGDRLGKEGQDLWDRVRGRDSCVLRPASLPETFEENVEFETPLETLEPLLFYVRRFVDQLALRLADACRAAEKVILELTREHAPSLRREFELPEPTTRSEILFRMLGTHLESLKSERRLTGVSLRVIPCPIQSKQRELFDAAVRDPHHFAETLARLAAVVGAGNVGSPRLTPTHRPDAFCMDTLNTEEKDRPETAGPPPPGPALRRFRPPFPARVRMRDGRPRSVASRVLDATLRDVRGPWRISGEWWRQDRWSREEWDVEVIGGGLYRLVREGETWSVEGMYD